MVRWCLASMFFASFIRRAFSLPFYSVFRMSEGAMGLFVISLLVCLVVRFWRVVGFWWILVVTSFHFRTPVLCCDWLMMFLFRYDV